MTQTTFDQRVSRLAEKHRRLIDGVSYRIGPDGLITAHPHRRFRPHFPVKGILLLLLAAFAFKTFLFVAAGEGTYNTRLAELAKGRTVERAAAWVMQPDPAMRGIAAFVAKITAMASDAASTDLG